MGLNADIELVCRKLDELASELAGGSPARVEEQAAGLEPHAAALTRLLEDARAGHASAQARDLCLRICRHVSVIRELLSHGEQVHAGLSGILSLLYTDSTGSQYSARGGAPPPGVTRTLAQA